jgi:hypothetical protein
MKNLNLFLQPSIAFVHNNFDAAFTLRFDYLKRNKTLIKDSVLSADDKEKYKFLEYNNYAFFQPAITLRAGFKYIKFQFQIAKSIPFSNNYKSIYGYGVKSIFDLTNDKNKMVFGFGLAGEINNIFKKKK